MGIVPSYPSGVPHLGFDLHLYGPHAPLQDLLISPGLTHQDARPR